jgi:hypothetical protein
MSQAYINNLTLDLLLNKDIKKKRQSKKENKEEIKFYRKRTYNLFKEIINGNTPEDLSPDVKYAYDNFVNSTINYFKTKDRNDIIQSEYKDFIETHNDNDVITDVTSNLSSNVEADKLLMRSIKINTSTLDKYVLKSNQKNRKNEIIMPHQKEINLNDPELKNKGIKKFDKKE